jgi:hypothetical protein
VVQEQELKNIGVIEPHLWPGTVMLCKHIEGKRQASVRPPASLTLPAPKERVHPLL